MAMSRAVGEIARHQVGHQVDALFLGFGDGILHGLLVQQAILHEALGEAPQGQPAGASCCCNCVVIHGLKSNPWATVKATIGSERINCQIKSEWSHIGSLRRVTPIAKPFPSGFGGYRGAPCRGAPKKKPLRRGASTDASLRSSDGYLHCVGA